MMRARRVRFVLVTLATVVAVLLTAALGVWQLGRAHTKREWLAVQAQQAALPPLDWAGVADAAARGALPAMAGRAVRLRGRWVGEATVFLDNRPMNGRAGFVVVTPLQPEAGGPALLVQRGWVARRVDDRQALPALATPTGVVEVEGRLAPPPSRLLAFGPDTPGPIRQNIDVQAFAAEWRLTLWPASVQQTAPPERTVEGVALLRDWTAVAVDPAKHVGYAVQWFALAALLLGLYVWFQFLSPRRRARAGTADVP